MPAGRKLWYILAPVAALASVAFAQVATPDDGQSPPDMSGPVDPQILLGDRAKTPDQREDAGPPEAMQQSDNAGSMEMSVPMESRVSTTTVTEESSSSVTLGQSDPAPDTNANSALPQPGWPGSQRGNRAPQSDWGPVTVLDAPGQWGPGQ